MVDLMWQWQKITEGQGSKDDMWNYPEVKEGQMMTYLDFYHPHFCPAGNTMNAIKNMLPGAQEESATDEVCALCPSLTYQQRLIGFCGCFALGYLLSFIGTLSLISMTTDGIRNFAALYVLGNIIALCSTGFLVGPKNQCKKMFDKTRRYSTILYMIMLIVVFAVALAGLNVFLVLFLLVIQVLVAVWYTLSYIPFGRQAVVGCMQNTLFKPCPGAIAGMV